MCLLLSLQPNLRFLKLKMFPRWLVYLLSMSHLRFVLLEVMGQLHLLKAEEDLYQYLTPLHKQYQGLVKQALVLWLQIKCFSQPMKHHILSCQTMFQQMELMVFQFVECHSIQHRDNYLDFQVLHLRL